MKQDGKEFSPINEGNPESLLQQAADGELVLFAAARRHTAQLHAFPWVVTPRQSNRSRAAGLVPIVPELANDLLCFPDSQLKMYLATDPTDCPDAHPWKDHYWVLDEPQPITREQLYSQAAPAVENEDVGNVKAMQALYGATEYTGDRPWLKHDSWDAELACKLIVFNYPVDMIGRGWDAVVNWPTDKWGRKSSIALRGYFDRALSIAKSSVNAGKIKEHDTPTNWIRWAEGKGYSVVHLIPADAPAAKVEARTARIPPGKMPKVASRKMAIKAAWQIELQNKRAASAKEVMSLLQSWADEGTEPDVLINSDRGKKGVLWRTAKGKENIFDIDACEKALKTWKESCQ
jgi:hypothetical protein